MVKKGERLYIYGRAHTEVPGEGVAALCADFRLFLRETWNFCCSSTNRSCTCLCCLGLLRLLPSLPSAVTLLPPPPPPPPPQSPFRGVANLQLTPLFLPLPNQNRKRCRHPNKNNSGSNNKMTNSPPVSTTTNPPGPPITANNTPTSLRANPQKSSGSAVPIPAARRPPFSVSNPAMCLFTATSPT